MAGTTKRQPAPTLEAVAAIAGVSRSTVSRVINGSSQVSPEVVKAVNAAVSELRYRPNRAARSLAQRKTMAIALVVPEDTNRFFGDPFFAEVVKGITEGLEPSDYVLNLQLAHPSAPSEKTIGYLLGGNVDGAIVVSHHSGDDFFTTLDATIPVVFGGRPFRPEIHDSSYVDVDNSAAAALGVQHLIDIGRKKIATIAGPADMQAAIDRTDGWVRTLRAAGMPTEAAGARRFHPGQRWQCDARPPGAESRSGRRLRRERSHGGRCGGRAVARVSASASRRTWRWSASTTARQL